MSGHRDATRFRRMFKLTMTTHSCDQRPTIIAEKLEDITNFHSSNLVGESIENQKPFKGGVHAAARIHSSFRVHHSSLNSRSRRSRPTIWIALWLTDSALFHILFEPLDNPFIRVGAV